MTEIQRVLRRAGWRLFLVDLPRTFTVTLSIVLAGLIGMRMVERVGGFVFDWRPIFIGAAVLAVVGAIGWSAARRARGLRLARELDERAGLRESLSTALCVADADDPWSRAVMRTARERAVTVKVARVIPVEQPRLLPLPMCLALALVVIWFTLPVLDLSGMAEERAQAVADRREAQEAKIEVTTMEDKLEELLKKAKVEDEGEELEELDGEAGEVSAEEIRRAALKKLTKLEETLSEKAEGEKAKQLDAMKQMMRQLKQPGPGPMEEFTRALSQGDFAKAKEALAELQGKLQNSELSEEAKERLREQMENLSRQLEDLAEQSEAVQEELQKAGMSAEQAKRAASDPAELQRAVEQMQNLSPEQKQQLLDKLLPKAAASQMCKGMSGEKGKPGQQGQQGMSDSEMLQQMSEMGRTLSEMEQMQSEMQGLSAALGEARSQMQQLGQGLGQAGMKGSQREWARGESSRQSPGSGGPGQGSGLVPDGPESPFKSTREQSDTKRSGGPIIGERLVYGDQIRGESRQAYREAVSMGQDAAAEAISSNIVEREYHEPLRRYFDGLLGRVESDSSSESSEDSAEDTSPAGGAATDATDAGDGDG